jgi:cytochrome P450
VDTASLTLTDLMQLNPAALANPYPIYKQVRDYAPMLWQPSFNGWLVTGYAETNAILRSAQTTAERTPTDEQMDAWGMGEFKLVFHMTNNQMLFRDPPAHTRLRGLVSKAFTPRTVENLRQRIEAIVDAAIDKALASGQMDIIADLAYPLPSTVIAEMMGVPIADINEFKRWSHDFALLLGNVNMSPDEMRPIMQSMTEFAAYFRQLTLRLREQPGDNLLSALAQAELQGEHLSEEELLANCVLLLTAGHETTTNLIGNGTLALLRNREQWQRLQDAPQLIPNAVEELLRFDSPVQLTSRVLTADTELGGQQVDAGQETLLLLGAANHDPAQYADADSLDVSRENVKHIAFGGGAHYCLGAPLARLEGQIAFARLLKRLPNMQLLTNDVEWRPNFGLRGLKSLPVSVGSRRV